MASRWLTLIQITLLMHAFEMFEAKEVVELCKTDCECCASAGDGSRNLLTICGGKSGTTCKFGCKDGFYGDRCYVKCPNYCHSCARRFGGIIYPDEYQICYKCADGFYNSTGITNCSTPCPTNCANNQCDKSTGHCLSGCKAISLTGNKCDHCSTGFFGGNCEPCPDYCKDKACSGNGGMCTKGCKNEWFTGDQCNNCKTGRHGQHCDKICPENCKNDICDKQDGICTDGCKGNHVGSKCEKCMDFLFGENCKKVCPRCLNGQCDRITGICDDCWDGYYTQYCNVTCSSGCKNMLCNRYNGTCTLGCKGGYSGDKCCIDANKCEICDTTSTCSEYNTSDNLAIYIASAALAVVLLSFIISVLNVLATRRWKDNLMQNLRGPSNSISYVNTIFQLTSEEDAVDVNADPIEPGSEYQNLEVNSDMYRHKYGKIDVESVNL